MKNTLNGAHILVTRPAHQAENLCQLIEQHGGVAVRLPTLQIVELEAAPADLLAYHTPATNPSNALSNPSWLIFTSANAVNFALKAIGGKIARFGTAKIAAIGQATAKALLSSGLEVDLLPEIGFDSEALLAMPQMQAVNSLTIVVVRGQGGREKIATTLRERGAKVDYWEVYRRIMPDTQPFEVNALLEQAKLSAVVITSTEALQNLVVMVGENYIKKLVVLPLVVISDRIKRFAADIGFSHIAVTDGPSDKAIVGGVIAILHGEKSG